MSDARTVYTAPDGRVLEIQTDMIEITSMLEPDPRWRYTDAAGHVHMASEGDTGLITYPTLETLTDHAHDDTEECDEYGCPWVRVCRVCGEVINSGTRTGRTRYEPGLTSYQIDGEEVDEATAREFVRVWQQAADDAAMVRGEIDRRSDWKDGYL